MKTRYEHFYFEMVGLDRGDIWVCRDNKKHFEIAQVDNWDWVKKGDKFIKPEYTSSSDGETEFNAQMHRDFAHFLDQLNKEQP